MLCFLSLLVMKGNSKELKPIVQPHSSHVIALSQACVNKLPGGSLTYVSPLYFLSILPSYMLLS
jgi:hypothetical protein